MDPFLSAAFLVTILVLVGLAAGAESRDHLTDDRQTRPAGR